MAESWLQSQWRALQDSYDPDEVVAGSQPVMIAGAAGSLALVLAAIGYLPFLAQASHFHRPWIALVLTGIAAVVTYVAYRHACRGKIGTLATFIDNGLYSAALTYAAMNTAGGYEVGLAVAHGLMVLAFPAHAHALTVPFASVMAAPLVAGLILFEPTVTVGVILVTSYILCLLLADLTRRRRELLRKQVRLTQAFGAASKVADESVQAALATTLLSLGHFLHELKNLQTAVRSNLGFIAVSAKLDEANRAALTEALEAQDAEQRLVRDTIDVLRQRARSHDSSFIVADVVNAAAREAKGVTVTVKQADTSFMVNGNPEHLRAVLTNLVRNADEAGASRVDIELRLEPSGDAERLTVHDDGPGILKAHRDRLFDSFGSSTKSSGSGLGLFLCRRYIELFGGTIDVGEGPLGGAAFVIRLPGRALPRGGETLLHTARVTAQEDRQTESAQSERTA